MRLWNLLGVAAVMCAASSAAAATYYVDYQSGADDHSGTQKDAAWQHSPGDPAAGGKVKGLKLEPGDVVKFKGGVIYRGTIAINESGTKDKPIIFDGNEAGDWGTGKAIVEGSVPLEGLQQCASADEVFGNTHFKNIYWTTVGKGAKWNTLNLCQGLTALAWSQEPNPGDPNFQEDLKYYYKSETDIPRTSAAFRVMPLGGMREVAARPLSTMFDGGNDSAVIDNIAGGGEVEVLLQQPVTVTELSVTPQPKYANPKEMSFMGDGKELLKVTLQNNPDKKTEQRFKLPQPATFKTLVIKFISAYPKEDGSTPNWGAVAAIGGYDAAGKNVLFTVPKSTFADAKVFTSSDPKFYDNALLALHAKPNFVYFKRILGYDPANHEIHIETLLHSQAPYDKDTQFCIVNSPRFIDVPGEYALMLDPEKDGSHKLFLWPPNGKAEDLTRGQNGLGLAVNGSFVTVEGFWVRKQGWDGSTGISARGPGTDLVLRDVKVSNLRGDGVGITTTLIDHVLVEGCEVSETAGHTKGIVLRNGGDMVVRGCTLRRNSSTALDFYTVHNAVVQDNVVVDNPGMHANGLTFYVGCKDILVERNLVKEGNVALTLEEGDRMIVRNNILEGGDDAPAIGFWAGQPYNDVVVTNNVLRYHGGPGSWAAALYGGNPAAHGYAIFNNVIDGLSGNVIDKADMKHNIFVTYGPGLTPQRLGDNLYVPKLDDIFVDAGKGDYHLKAGSPAIDAGVALTTINDDDRDGVARPVGKAVDIGPYEAAPADVTAKAKPVLADPHTFKFTFDGYTIQQPVVHEAVYTMKFKKIEGGKTITLKGVDFTGQGGGKVNLRPTKGGFISGWDKPGHWVEWTVDAPVAGDYEVAIEHASETPAKREVLVNGEPVKGLEAAAFPATGSWTKFEKMGLDVPLKLKAGKNVVRFMNVSGSHNFETLEFIPVEGK